MRIGYARVSTQEQNLARQLEALKDCDEVFQEKISGKDRERPELANLLKYARKGDTIVFPSLDRMSRSLGDAISIIGECREKSVNVELLHENMTFSGVETDPYTHMQFSMLAVFAEFERNIIRQRQKEGIAIAKAKGVYAKPRKLTPEVVAAARRKVEQGIPKARIARDLGISRASLYRALGDRPAGQEAA